MTALSSKKSKYWNPLKICILISGAFVILCGLISLGLTLFFVLNDKEVEEDVGSIKERLPRVMEIQSYNLTIQPYFPFKGLPKYERQDFTFDGNVTIHFTMTNNFTTKFSFYSDGLKISKIFLLEDDKPVKIKSVTIYTDTDLGIVEINKNFELGKKYSVFFEFSGIILRDSDGLFYNEYRDEDGNKRYLIATHFEPIAARKIFPCADDPHFKSKITLTLIHPKLSKVYSNSEIDREIQGVGSNKKVTTFKPTPYMSSYLLAFSVGDFYETSTKSKSGVPIRIISYKNVSMNQEAELAAKCLDTMEKLTGVPYLHTKLDHIWVEWIDGTSAMENWGLVMYSDLVRSLLSENPTEGDLYKTYSLICHETSHQWFGNLVTGDHWGQLFLHESFAEYFGNHALLETPKVIDSKIVEENIVQSRNKGLNEIAKGEHAIATNTFYFDAVTYEAGAILIRMLENVVGREKFYKALNIYLTKNAFKTATHKDLIGAFEEALENQPLCNDLKIREFLEDFLLQAAYPEVHIKIENQQFVFEQQPSKNESNFKWNIPLFVREKENSTEEKPRLIWVLKNNTLCLPESKNKLDPTKQYDFNVNLYSFAKVFDALELDENVIVK